MNTQLANYFFAEASQVLAFVVSKHGFSAPVLEIDDRIAFAYVTFMGTHLAIECSLDEREGDVACVIARVVNGRKSTYLDATDGRDDRGMRIREHLSVLLRRKGVRERLFTRVGGLEAAERISVTLRDFALMLEKYGRAILEDSPTALE